MVVILGDSTEWAYRDVQRMAMVMNTFEGSCFAKYRSLEREGGYFI